MIMIMIMDVLGLRLQMGWAIEVLVHIDLLRPFQTQSCSPEALI